MTEQELEQTKTRVAELGRRVAHFLDVVKKAGANYRNDGKGMQVSYFGDFASITPSTLHSLEWFARAFAENVDSVPALLLEVERLTAEVGMLRGVGCMEDGDGPCGVCRKCAFKRGVAAMREVVVKSVTCQFPTINAGGKCGLCTFCDDALDKHILALPDPEDKP